MKGMSYHEAIDAQRRQIEKDVRRRLHNMEDVIVDTGRKIHAEDVIDRMQEIDPDGFAVAIFLCSGRNTSAQVGRGVESFTGLRTKAVEQLIQDHGNSIYSLAASQVEASEA